MMKYRITRFLVLIVSMVTVFTLLPHSAYAFTLLHSFAGGASDGSQPNGNLTLSGSTAYGTTTGGGSAGGGTIFSINTDGTGFTLLHTFVGGASDGIQPFQDGLVLSGSTLYGMTYNGGATSRGVIFSINTNGTGFTVLHSFSSAQGTGPDATLTLSGSTLYGTTTAGGSGDGTVFSINTNGTGFTVLHTFTGGASDGSAPQGNLTLSGSTLYGTAFNGGSADDGVIFSLNTDGTGFTLLHTFTGGDGGNPNDTLTLSGSTLYGTAEGTGTGIAGDGTIFSININGTGFTLLHTFTGVNDGNLPTGNLTLSGSTLYGMTYTGGSADDGVIFSLNTNGTSFTLLHTFTGGANDGWAPNGSLTLSGSTFYGMTQIGGSSNNGTIFSLPGPVFPTFTSVSTTTGYIKAGNSVSFTTVASDSDSDNVTLYVCKANDFTGSACGAGGTWCSSSASASNPTCSYTVQSSDTDGSHTYYANIIDSGNTSASNNPLSGTFLTDVTPPTVSAGSNQTTSSAFTTSATASDTASGIASYQWSYTGSGNVVFQTPTNLNTLVNATAGTYTVTLTVTDVAGNSGSGSFTLTWSSSTSSSSAGGNSNAALLALLPHQNSGGVSPTPTPTPVPTPSVSPPSASGSPTTSSSPPHPYFPRYLGYADHGDDVLALQELLTTLGLFPSTTTPNGHYGPATARAVKLFQKAHGIRTTGNVGPVTKAALQGE